MKKMKHITSICLLLFLSVSLFGQLELPKKSPHSSISYTVGLTKITVDYSSPSVKERTIWGDLVAYDKIWRAGANEATTIEFSTDVVIGKQNLPKGKYSLFIIPKAEGKWTAIFNKVADQWGAYAYDEKQDALRVDIQVKDSKSSEERLSFNITDLAIDRGYIRLAWEKKRAYILFRSGLLDLVAGNVAEASKTAETDKKWLIHAQAADFYLDNEHQELAVEQIKVSVELSRHSRNSWIEAKINAAGGDYKKAIESAMQALDLGKKADSRFYNNYKEDITAKIETWKTK